eukprot:EC124130.1.p1 GENE.EC124130.1~~EC124130.1.p1  ORF type:complete len:176 (+),score=15.38 EC124130.1:68-595(+)
MQNLAFTSLSPNSFTNARLIQVRQDGLVWNSHAIATEPAHRCKVVAASSKESVSFRTKRCFFEQSRRPAFHGSRIVFNNPGLTGAEKPVLVDFYAKWCGPCHMMAPILDQVNTAFKGKLMVVKLDTDVYPTIAAKYQVQALPTLILFKGGEPVERIEGLVPAEDLIPYLQPLVSA